MQVVTVEQMRSLEHHTKVIHHLSDMDLMERAAKGLKDKFIARFPDKKTKCLFFIGKGHNGQDTQYLCHYLKQEGYDRLECLYLASFVKETDFQHLDFSRYAVIVDGMFGIGFKDELCELHQKLFFKINREKKFTISVDIPSGLDGTSGIAKPLAIQADLVLAIGRLKTGNVMNQALDYVKETDVVDIALMDFPFGDAIEYLELTKPHFPKRMQYSNKYDYGSVLTFGGDLSMQGSAMMAAFSALRCGCGLSTVVFPKSSKGCPSLPYPELIVHQAEKLEDIEVLMQKKDAICFGCGMTDETFHPQWLEAAISLGKPLVIDAYAIDKVPHKGNLSHLFLTPHLGEFARMFGKTSKEIPPQLFDLINETKQWGLNIVLKGPVSVISTPNRTVLVRTGHPGMAKAGMGDVFSGILAAMFARKYEGVEAVLNALWIHTYSANLAKTKIGVEGMVTSDVISYISDAVKQGETS